jgi:hypothetical protein
MFQNLSIGLDIATALSVIAAAAAFIWNSALARKKSKLDRRKEIMISHVYRTVEALYKGTSDIIKIVYQIRDGEHIQNLNNWKDLVIRLTDSFRWLIPLDQVYGDGRFQLIYKEYSDELDEFIHRFAKLVSPDSNESWDFYDTMDTPNRITLKYITRLYQETENYLNQD